LIENATVEQVSSSKKVAATVPPPPPPVVVVVDSSSSARWRRVTWRLPCDERTVPLLWLKTARPKVSSAYWRSAGISASTFVCMWQFK